MNLITKSVLRTSHLISRVLLVGCLALIGCSQQEAAKPVIYEGPLSEAEDVTMFYTEKEVVKVMLQAKKIFEFQNGDQEFPEGIYIEFFDEFGKITRFFQWRTSCIYFAEISRATGKGSSIRLRCR